MKERQKPELSNVTLAVLAGGSGQRMGLPKAWLQLGQKTVLSWLLERLQWPGPTMLVSAPGAIHPPSFEMFDREVTDPVDGLGPLRGVLTALENTSTPMVAVITVDMPAVNQAMLAALIDMLEARSHCAGLMCQVRREIELQIEPFPSIFRVEAASIISMRLNSGRRSVRSLCDEELFVAIDAPVEWPASAWLNLNTSRDLASFETTLKPREAEQKK